MRLINADMIVYYFHTNADGKFVGELAWKDQIDSIPTYDIEKLFKALREENDRFKAENERLKAENRRLRTLLEDDMR